RTATGAAQYERHRWWRSAKKKTEPDERAPLPSWRIELLLRSELSDDSQRLGRVDVPVLINRHAARHEQSNPERGLVAAPACAATGNYERIAGPAAFYNPIVHSIGNEDLA